MTDPVCLHHGEPKSKHLCLTCCLCFKSITVEECTPNKDGIKEDVCAYCRRMESGELPRVVFLSAPHIGEALYIDKKLVMLGDRIYPTGATGENGMPYARLKTDKYVSKWPENMDDLSEEVVKSCVEY